MESEMTIDFSIRDFKYMSHKNQTLTLVTNPAQLNGTANITFPINFQNLTNSDSTGNSYFVVGGRAYFEASVIGANTNSFVTKGFFDQANYQEPDTTVLVGKAIWVSLLCGSIFLVLLLVGCYYKKKNQEELTLLKFGPQSLQDQ